MIRVLTQQNPVVLNGRIIAGERYSNLPDNAGSGNAGMFSYNPTQTSGQPYGVLANQQGQGGFTDLATSVSKMTSGQQGQEGGANPMDIVSTLAPLANQLLQKRQLSEVESVCGKQPSFLASKSKKEAWQRCANNYAKSKAQQTKVEAKEPAKMSTTTKVLLGVGGVAILGTIIYFIAKKK